MLVKMNVSLLYLVLMLTSITALNLSNKAVDNPLSFLDVSSENIDSLLYYSFLNCMFNFISFSVAKQINNLILTSCIKTDRNLNSFLKSRSDINISYLLNLLDQNL